MRIVERIKNWALNNIAFLFVILRNTRPTIRLKSFAVVSRFTDVQEVLSRPDAFGIIYTEKMGVITGGGNFFLGMNNTPEYTRDASNMRLVVRRSDTETMIPAMIERLASSIVDASNGSMDVVQELTQPVSAQFVAQYLGVPGPSQEELINWSTDMFHYLFYPDTPAEIDEKATRYAALARDYLDNLIAARKGEDDNKDDVLARCLQLQPSGTPGMSDIDIRNNLIGIIIGAIPTTSKVAAMVIDYLLDNPELLAAAQQAARKDDTETIRKTVLEAMRFNSFGAGLFRIANQDYVIAKGTLRRAKIPKGTKVLVLTQSAMLDGRELTRPNAFSLDRPDYQYMHFGYGMHTCFGLYINMAQIPIIVKSVLKRNNLRRAPGDAGIMKYDGPFPRSLQVQFDRAT